MEHKWKKDRETDFDEETKTWSEVMKCEVCLEESEFHHWPSTSTTWSWGGECSGVTPIKVRIINQ